MQGPFLACTFLTDFVGVEKFLDPKPQQSHEGNTKHGDIWKQRTQKWEMKLLRIGLRNNTVGFPPARPSFRTQLVSLVTSC